MAPGAGFSLSEPEDNPLPPINRIECSSCLERFWLRSKYVRHFIFSCNICNKDFCKQKHFDKHNRHIHGIKIDNKQKNNYALSEQNSRSYVLNNNFQNLSDNQQPSEENLHMQLYSVPMQLYSVPLQNGPVVKKEIAHENIFLESRNATEFPDDKQHFTDEDSSDDSANKHSASDLESKSSDDNNISDKVITTRSGRVVKPRKLFEEWTEINRMGKKSKQSFSKMSVTADKVEPKSSQTVEPTVVNNFVLSNHKVEPYEVNINMPISKRSEQSKKTINNTSNVTTSLSELSTKSQGNCVTGPNSKECSFQNVATGNNLNVSASKLPKIGKDFLYVGRKQDMNNIIKVIQVVKAKENNYGANTNDFSQADNVNKKTGGSDNSAKGDRVMANLPFESTDGDILNKSVVQDFLVIKVTPEYMQQMQKQNLDSSEAQILKSKEYEYISMNMSSTSSDMRYQMSLLNEGIEESLNERQTYPLNVKTTSSTDVNATNLTTDASEIHNKKGKQITLESFTATREFKGLFAKYQAKMEEKERKKKKKYEMKKKKHMEMKRMELERIKRFSKRKKRTEYQ